MTGVQQYTTNYMWGIVCDPNFRGKFQEKKKVFLFIVKYLDERLLYIRKIF